MNVQELSDKQALYELACRYFQAVDRKDIGVLEELYHPDAIHDHGAMFVGSPRELIDWLSQSMTSITTQHFLGNHLFSLEGERANGELYTINYHVLHSGGADRDYVAGGRYIDEYVRFQGEWRIWRRERKIDWTHHRPSIVNA